MNVGGLVSDYKKKLFVIAIFITVIFGSIIIYLVFGVYVDTYGTSAEIISVSDKDMKISGGTASSGQAFAGYNYTIKDDNLYLKLRYCIVNPIHRYGDFNITIKGNMKNIKNVYLQGIKSEDKKVVYIP
jgi:hypothetical protein